MTDLADFRAYCLAKPNVTEGTPFGPDTLVFKVGGKMFALASLDEIPPRVNLKCDPDRALDLRDRYEEVQPGYHMNKKHWNTVELGGADSRPGTADWIDHSYELVAPAQTEKALMVGRDAVSSGFISVDATADRQTRTGQRPSLSSAVDYLAHFTAGISRRSAVEATSRNASGGSVNATESSPAASNFGPQIFVFQQLRITAAAQFCAESTRVTDSPRNRPIALAAKRIMRAAEHERINPFFDQRREILPNDPIGDLTFQPAFFDQRNKERTGPRRDLHRLIERLDRALVGAALDRGARPDHSDMADCGSRRRRLARPGE